MALDRCNGVVVRAFASKWVDLGSFPLSSHTNRLFKMVFAASLLGTRHLWEVVENKPTSSLVVSSGKALNPLRDNATHTGSSAKN